MFSEQFSENPSGFEKKWLKSRSMNFNWRNSISSALYIFFFYFNAHFVFVCTHFNCSIDKIKAWKSFGKGSKYRSKKVKIYINSLIIFYMSSKMWWFGRKCSNIDKRNLMIIIINLMIYEHWTNIAVFGPSSSVVLNVGSMAAHQGLMRTFLRPTIHYFNIYFAKIP